jgi:DNA-binding NarL/FixJ family response regulator
MSDGDLKLEQTQQSRRDCANVTSTKSLNAAKQRTSQSRSILVVEHMPLLRAALISLLIKNALVAKVVGSANLDAVEPSSETFDVILLDLELPGFSGVTSIAAARALHPNAAIIALSTQADKSMVLAALDIGASGYLPKTFELPELVAAIEVVLRGGIFVPFLQHSSTVQQSLKRRATDKKDVAAPAPHRRASDRTLESCKLNHLSERQKEVLSLLVRGLTNKRISKKLSISENTVKAHIAQIFRALGVSNRLEAVAAVSARG